MSFDPFTAALDLGKMAIERLWPDPNKRAEEMRLLEELRQKGDLAELNAHVQLMLGQLEVNKMEAQHKSIFVAGWRPFVGWTCGGALAWQFIAYPMLMWLWQLLKAFGAIPDDIPPPPILETGALFTLLLGMLGIGTMRSIDKKHGVQTDRIK